jgi:PKD repeat protein
MTRWLRVCLAISGVLLVAAGAHHVSAQTAPKIAWDESSTTPVNGYALTIDGVRTDYKLTPLSSTGTCGCMLPLPFSGGRHTIVVSAYNASGEVASAPLTVAPIANPGGPYTGVAGSPITVSGGASSHPAGTIVGYTWTWGDGSKSGQLASSSASHTYAATGTYQITLMVTDNAGATASATTIATITTQTQTTLPSTVVLWANDTLASKIHGSWTRTSDASAAGRVALWNPNAGRKKISPALAAPTTYFEQTFHATAGTPYHLWVRLRAEKDSFSNDSVHVQFSDSTDANGAATMRLGTSSSAEVVLQNGPNGGSVHGWGWSDNGWGSLGNDIYFATTGTHTIRVQQREDGAIVDQLVLSPDRYLISAPGTRRDDATILPNTEGTSQTANTSVAWASDVALSNIHGHWQRLADSSAAGGTALENPNAGAAKISPALANPANYFDATFSAKAGLAYHVWIRLRAQNNSMSNDSVHAQFNDALNASNAAYARIGTTNSAEFVLQNGPNASSIQGWGWTDNGWGTLGPAVYFATSGTHTIRIQQREDGAIVDQIVISADAYTSAPPGARLNDNTIVGK